MPLKSDNITLSNNLTPNPDPGQADHQIVMEHNYAEYPGSSNSEHVDNKESEDETVTNNIQNTTHIVGIKIKLKYINDDLKVVDGKLDESLGDFKK